MKTKDSIVALEWEWGTGYDFFVSLYVLHEPAEFGLRASWAAGVRSRLPAEARKVLDEGHTILQMPYRFLLDHREPKDVQAILATLRSLPAGERLYTLLSDPNMSPEADQIMKRVTHEGAYAQQDLQVIADQYPYRRFPHPLETSRLVMDWLSRSQEYGDCYLEALQAYHTVFFQEEEIRIRPALESALKHAQERARVVSALKLVEELSKGLLIQSLESLSRLVMAPSYWCTPLLVSARLPENGRFFLFGARPEDTTLVPGDWVPETLVRMMKAAGEPTRLRILRRLAHEPMTSSQLARLLRLRVPTVLHHLHELRLAGLIQIRLMEGDEKTYTIRKETVDGMVKSFREFLDISAEDSE